MKKMFFSIIFSCLISVSYAHSDRDLFLYWLEEAGEGLVDVNQQIRFYPPFPPDQVPTTGKTPLEMYKFPFTQLYRVFGAPIPEQVPLLVDTKVLPKNLLSKVLKRRKPIFNSFSSPQKPAPKKHYSFLFGMDVCFGYLEYIQLTVINQLIANRDLRFEVEIRDLQKYLSQASREQEEDLIQTHYNFLAWQPSLIVSAISFYLKQFE